MHIIAQCVTYNGTVYNVTFSLFVLIQSCRMDPLTEEPGPSCRMDPLTEEPGPSCRMDPLTEEPGPLCRMDPLTEEPGPDANNSEVENPANSPGTATQLDIDTIQMEIDRWEEYYDHIKHYLVHGSLQKNSKSVQKSIHNYLIGSDGQLYRNKISKDGVTCTKVLVIRSYEDRLRICKDIHVNTGEEGRHHRRDKMLEIIGRQYYWKGQRRDICECVSLLMSMLFCKCSVMTMCTWVQILTSGCGMGLGNGGGAGGAFAPSPQFFSQLSEWCSTRDYERINFHQSIDLLALALDLAIM